VLGLFYYLRVIAALFAQPEPASASGIRRGAGAVASAITLCALSVALIALGVYPEPAIEFVRLAARALQ
jgi:NADH:ubiquinone oxidoreductase subunit 2 (subunit N)